MAGLPGSNVAELVGEAERLLSEDQADEAVPLLERALELEPGNTAVMDDLAQVLLEVGEVDRATALLERSIAAAPDVGHEKYMLIGQMMAGEDALRCFQKGSQLLEEALARAIADQVEQRQLKQQLAAAYCSMVEVFLTDSCYDPTAEQECEKLLELALDVDPHSLDALVLRAQVLLSQIRPDGALPVVLQAATRSQQIIDADTDESTWPAMPLRLQLVKLLIELEQWREAINMLETLVQQDDNDVEMWYLLGFSQRKAQRLLSCEEAMERAQLLLQQFPDSVPQVAHQQIQQLAADLANDRDAHPEWIEAELAERELADDMQAADALDEGYD